MSDRYEIHLPYPEGSTVIGHTDIFEEANRIMHRTPNAEAYDTVRREWVPPEPEWADSERKPMPTDQQQPDVADSAALDQIAAILGLYTTDPANNPKEEVLADVAHWVQATGRRTDVPEGG